MTFGHLAGADTHAARLENQRHLKMAVPSPFTAASDTLTIAAGDQTGRVEVVALNDDDASESNETFTLTLSNPSNATLGTKSTANGTIAETANSAPVFSEDSTTREVANGSPTFTPVGDPVTATDADNDDLIYTVKDETNSFGISPSSGQIRVLADSFHRASYLVTVEASDGTASDTIAVTINITGLEDGPSEPEPEPVPALPLLGQLLLALLLGTAALRRRRRAGGGV